MGTTYSIKYSGALKIEPKKISENIEDLLVEFNLVCSTYISNSEISKVNRPGLFKGKVSSEFAFLFNSGALLSKETLGNFDPSIGPLVNLWGFGPTKPIDSPSPIEVEQAKKSVGLHHFSLSSVNQFSKKSKNNSPQYT